jgi:homospermidine synthase
MIGMLMPHGESVTIGDHLSLLDEDGNVIFRPTVYFVYCPCDAACNSMREVEAQGFKMHGMTNRLMLNDIVSGKDKLGVLLLGHDYKSWWTGSLLSIEKSRELVPGQNATSMQVASSAIGGMIWAIKNPNRGVLNADTAPWKEVLPYVKPYLGEFISIPVDWDPLSTRVDLYKGWNTNQELIDESDPWQFCNFQIPGAPSIHF